MAGLSPSALSKGASIDTKGEGGGAGRGGGGGLDEKCLLPHILTASNLGEASMLD